jgi:hypothetical protein
MNELNLKSLADQILKIEQDLPSRLKDPSNMKNMKMKMFEQMWGSSTLGFSGVGMDVMTNAWTFVFWHPYNKEDAVVYFGGKYAYTVPLNENVRKDINREWMRSVSESKHYLEKE